MRWVFFVFLFASFASAQANLRINPGDHANRAAEYRQLVASYCRLDYDGARLTPDGWNRVKAMTSFRENPDFRRIVVINRYEMAPDATNTHGRAIFSVTYDVIGEYDMVGGYIPSPSHMTTQIEAGEINGDARVLNIAEQHPFVGRMRFEQWMKSRIAGETDPAAKAFMQASLDQFEDQTKKPVSAQ